MLESSEWWEVISNYNHTIFPFQFIILLIGVLITIYLFYGESIKANILVKAYLAFCNLWIGIVFFLINCTEFSSPQREIQGIVFIVVGVLFAIDIFSKKTNISIPKVRRKRLITIVLLSLIIIYPIVGLLLRGSFDKAIYPGTLPCATTAYALVLLVGSLPKVNKLIFILLLIWAIPFPVLIQIPMYHVYEDSIMFGIGIYALVMLILSIKDSRKNTMQINEENIE